jgi:hypothetical protein
MNEVCPFLSVPPISGCADRHAKRIVNKYSLIHIVIYESLLKTFAAFKESVFLIYPMPKRDEKTYVNPNQDRKPCPRIQV